MFRRFVASLGDLSDEEQAWCEKIIVIVLSGACTIAGLVVVYLHDAERMAFILWAGAFLASGFLLGFLFGIPRTLQSEQPPPGAASEGYEQRVNTNLEYISDWLTKIIVGLGLVQLGKLPSKLDAAAQYVACGPGNTCEQKVFAGATLVYFAVVGFLAGYLLTRLFLAPAFRRVEDPGKKLARVMAGKSPIPEVPGKSRQAVETISVVLSAFRDLEAKAASERLQTHIGQLESMKESMPLSRELFIVLGRLYKNFGEYDKAIETLTRFIDNKKAAAALDTDTATALYNRACYYTLQMSRKTGDEKNKCKRKALDDLQEALKISPSDRASARTDPDFEALRNEPEFQALTEEPLGGPH